MICLNSIMELIGHQNDVADVASINAGRKFLGGREDCRDRFFGVLKITQVLFARRAIVPKDRFA
jgi:hypothetical protein